MMLMSKLESDNNNSFYEITLADLIEIVGSSFIELEFKEFLQPIFLLSDRKQILLTIIKNTFDNSFSIYDRDTNDLLIVIDKCEDGGWFCKPIDLMYRMTVEILTSLREELDELTFQLNEKFDENNIVDDLFFCNELPDNDKLNDYFYKLAIIMINEFNLNIMKSKLVFHDNKKVIIDGNKRELIFNAETNTIEDQEVVYMVSLKIDSLYVKVVKIFEDDKKTVHLINLNDYFCQDVNLLF